MGHLVGLTGKPNVGKSTFFSAATLATVKIASYPFTTIEPNVGTAFLRRKCVCKELGVTDNPINSTCINGERFIPVTLVDLPGLVPGAHMGRGLGNRFLTEVSTADVLIHVVDASGGTDEEGRPVKPGTRDPLEDIGFLEREYVEWMKGIVWKDWPRLSKLMEQTKRDIAEVLAEKLTGLSIGYEEVEESIEKSGLEAKKPMQWREEDVREFCRILREQSKPIVIAANKADKEEAEENIRRMKEAGYEVIPTSAEAELVLRKAERMGYIEYLPGDGDFRILRGGEMNEKQLRGLQAIRERVLDKWGSTGVQKVLNYAYFDVLGLIVVYPVENPTRYTDKKGNVLPDVYLVKRGTTVRKLAYMIHSDLGEKFIYGINAKTKMRIGEDYVLQDGDVISIVSAA
ncbi:MAG TPA: redox-regulated ATPase YchF [Candidatus Bathyarchaeota archaeon]|nr:redox-regulated ATPase YchF [Candidatus Bathyarchaeota archaeon]